MAIKYNGETRDKRIKELTLYVADSNSILAADGSIAFLEWPPSTKPGLTPIPQTQLGVVYPFHKHSPGLPIIPVKMGNLFPFLSNNFRRLVEVGRWWKWMEEFKEMEIVWLPLLWSMIKSKDKVKKEKIDWSWVNLYA